MKRALVATSVASMVDQFLLPSVFLLKNSGYEVHILCNFYEGNTCSDEQIKKLQAVLTDNDIKYFQVDFARNVTKITQNLSAYKQVSEIVKNNRYDLVHCHSPIGGLVTRLACRKVRKQGTKVIYTAHGFHFYKGAPLKNWMLYYPVEKLCSYFTDVLITINHEDYNLAKKKMKAKQVEYVPGVGIDLTKFGKNTFDKSAKRKELGIPDDAIILTSVGELNTNKNHQVILRAMSLLNNNNLYYLIAGKGDNEENLLNLAKKLNIQNLRLLGYRNDIPEIYNASDICCFPSIREGLGLAAIEGMACGLPLIAADNRGTRDFCKNNVNGFLCNPFSVEDFANAIEQCINDSANIKRIVKNNTELAKKFDCNIVNEVLLNIYNAF